MEFDISKENLNDLMKKWIRFREEELLSLTKEDKKHPLKFDESVNKILKSIPYKNRKYVLKELTTLYDNFLDFSNYYTEKYYRAGFADCLNLVIASIKDN